jgi:hypothetical protein
MSRIVFMVEEESMATFLNNFLPRLFPDLRFLCIPHEGKRDLEISLPRKLKAWRQPDDRFVVIRDGDGKDCLELKANLAAICSKAGRPDTLIRIACQELEAWYLGDPEALATVFPSVQLRTIAKRPKYRDPDSLRKPSAELQRLCPDFQKISGARAIASHISHGRNSSRSFRVLIDGIARISGCPMRVAKF